MERRRREGSHEMIPRREPRQQKSTKRTGHKVVFILGTVLLVGICTVAMLAGLFMMYVRTTLAPTLEVNADDYTMNLSSIIYYQDRDTGDWVEYQTVYGTENRIWVDLENIPKYLQDAAVAIEDKRFEKHHGVDWKGTTRAILYTLFGKNVQGGSTITQQLVKNVTGDNQVTVKRKITEIYRALELEKRYEKDEILEAYLNEVYFGQRCSGVMTAARVYFGKDVSELSLAECASMMGITNNPSMYDPFISSWTRENNRERQLTILSEMLSQGKIDQEEYDAAVAEDIQFANGFTISGKYVGSDGTGTEPDTEDTTDTSDDTDSPADDSTPTIKGSNSWFTDAMITDVAEALVEKLGITEKVNSEGKKISAYDQAINMVYSKGYKIYTTQNPKYQKIAEDVCYNLENIPYTSSYTNAAGEQVEDQLQIALTIVDPTNGYVVAMIGGAGEKVVGCERPAVRFCHQACVHLRPGTGRRHHQRRVGHRRLSHAAQRRRVAAKRQLALSGSYAPAPCAPTVPEHLRRAHQSGLRRYQFLRFPCEQAGLQEPDLHRLPAGGQHGTGRL